MKTPMLLFAAVMLVACDSSSDGDDDDDDGHDDTDAAPGTVTVSGSMINHSMNRLAGSPELSQLTISVLDAAVATSPTGPALVSGPQSTAACATMGACDWSLSADVAGVTGGLAGRISDDRAGDPVWITTITAFSTAAEVAAATSDQPITSGRAFAVSRAAIDTVVAPMVGLTGDEILARGIVFGLVYDGVSTDGSGTPVSGATVTATAPDVLVVYPNNNFTGTGNATGTQGAFLAVPAAAGAATVTSFVITPPPDLAATWDEAQTATVIPGAMYFTLRFSR